LVCHGGKLQGFFGRKPSLTLGEASGGGGGLTDRELMIVAPNLVDQMYLYRPTAMFSNPPFCTLHELRTIYTIDDLADFHEVINLRNATADRRQIEAERRAQIDASRRGRGHR
jgi:hypothetical protein